MAGKLFVPRHDTCWAAMDLVLTTIPAGNFSSSPIFKEAGSIEETFLSTGRNLWLIAAISDVILSLSITTPHVLRLQP